MRSSQEFADLVAGARELGIPIPPEVQYRSHNSVLRHLRFHWLEWGDPGSPSLLLLHGGHQSAHSWDLVSLALSEHFHVIALDQRGHGDSEWARNQEYSLPSMAEDALALTAHLELREPVIVGHSAGGLVALTMLARGPGVASRAVIVDVGLTPNPGGSAAIYAFIHRAAEFADVESFVETVHAYDRRRSRENIERTAKYNLIQRSDGRFVSKCDPAFTRARSDKGDTDRPTPSQVATIRVPLLIVRGERSDVLTPEAAREFVKAVSGAELVTVSASGHNVASQNPVGFLQAVEPFLLR